MEPAGSIEELTDKVTRPFAWTLWLVRKCSKYAIWGGVFLMLISFKDDARSFGIGRATALIGIVGWLMSWIIGRGLGQVNR